jgi:hypothetical protein
VSGPRYAPWGPALLRSIGDRLAATIQLLPFDDFLRPDRVPSPISRASSQLEALSDRVLKKVLPADPA